ncbi:MAG: hypothetical protein AB7Q29_18125 [Vicinamibacterales bacterium]
MAQIRARIREKRGADYTADEIRELAGVRLDRFLDSRRVRSDLLTRFRDRRPPLPFVSGSLFAAKRPIVARIRRYLHPVLRLFFNPDPVTETIACVNEISTTMNARTDLYYELLHNLVVELSRTAIELKNVQMQVDSLTGRLEFNERRARALESVVQYRESPVPDPLDAHQAPPADETPGARSRRRRARRGRRRPGSAAARMAPHESPGPGSSDSTT